MEIHGFVKANKHVLKLLKIDLFEHSSTYFSVYVIFLCKNLTQD